MSLFSRKPKTEPEPLDAEFDVEGARIMSIERQGTTTTIYFSSGSAWALRCTDEKHADIMRRFRLKIRVEQHPYQATEFDIEGMPVFSVERSEDGLETIIGTRYGKKRKSWYLPCTLQEHNDYVARLKKKNQAAGTAGSEG